MGLATWSSSRGIGAGCSSSSSSSPGRRRPPPPGPPVRLPRLLIYAHTRRPREGQARVSTEYYYTELELHCAVCTQAPISQARRTLQVDATSSTGASRRLGECHASTAPTFVSVPLALAENFMRQGDAAVFQTGE